MSWQALLALPPPEAAQCPQATDSLIQQTQSRPSRPTLAMTKNKYTVILPTYNERKNLPVIVYLINDTFTQQYGKSQNP
jgi:hypothetical protein